MVKGVGAASMIILPIFIFLYIYIFKRLVLFAPIWMQLLLCLLIFTIDQKRADSHFINYLKNKGKLFVFVDYTMLMLIFELPILIFGKIDFYIFLPIALTLILSYFRNYKFLIFFQKIDLTKKLTSFLPMFAFEWQAGIRKQKILFFISYFIGLGLIFFFPITPIMMLYWLTFSGDFYSLLENKEIIQSFNTIENFKKKKLISFLKTINLIYLPHYLLFIILYPLPQMLILGSFILVFNLFFLFAFIFKYTFVGTSKRAVENTIPIIKFTFIAFILPISLFYIFNTWKISKNKLTYYLK